MRKIHMLFAVVAFAAMSLFAMGCDTDEATSLLQSLGVTIDVEGTVEFPNEEVPLEDLSFKIYSKIDNPDAFDDTQCDAWVAASGSASTDDDDDAAADDDDAAAEEKLAAQQDDDDDDAAADDDDDASAEGEASGAVNCYGSLILENLTTVSQQCEDPEARTGCEDAEYDVFIDGSDFSLLNIPFDFAFVLIVEYTGSDFVCTTDIIGYDEETATEGSKVVTSDSAIGPKDIGDALSATFAVPRNVSMNCNLVPVASEDPIPPDATVPDPVSATVDDPPAPTDDAQIPEPDVPAWTGVQLLEGKMGDVTILDVDAGTASDDTYCTPPEPNVLHVIGTLTDAPADQKSAFLHLQFGAADNATVQNLEVPLVDGAVDQVISLPGGFVAMQLDADETMDGVGESAVMTLCVAEELPAQEMLVIMSWDTDGDDVDLHLFNGAGEHTWYADLTNEWGSLDIDDTNGFGPETFVGAAIDAGETYEVQVHYYSDHGTSNVPVVTVRVIYVKPTTHEVCDISVSGTIAEYEWVSLGIFGPDTVCP